MAITDFERWTAECREGQLRPRPRLTLSRTGPTNRAAAPVPQERVGAELLSRQKERAALNGFVSRVRGGAGEALVLRGEAGIGKSSLLDHLSRTASGSTVTRTTGIPAEQQLEFAALQALCGGFLDRVDRLAEPQREALGVALGLRAGPAPDRLLVGLGFLALLSDLAADGPLLCLVDNAHWLDRSSMQACSFAAHRLTTSSIGMVFATLDSFAPAGLAGLADLVVGRLTEGDSKALLRSEIVGPVDEAVLDRIVSDARGNPSCLLDFARRVKPGTFAGGFSTPSISSAPEPLERMFQQRYRSLPGETRQLLLLAAAEPTFDPVLIQRAARLAQLGPDAGAPAVEAGLIDAGHELRFCHPLVRSAIYRDSSASNRLRAHQALADADGIDAVRRSWHRGHATLGPDDEVAAELWRAAGPAQARGGLAAAAAFHEQAANLTADPGTQASRQLEAAEISYRAGNLHSGQRLVTAALAGLLDDVGLARAWHLQARIAASSDRGHNALVALLDAARALEARQAGRALDAYGDAVGLALDGGHLLPRTTAFRLARAALDAGERASGTQAPPHPGRLLLAGLATVTTSGLGDAIPLLRQALLAHRPAEAPEEEDLRWTSLAVEVAHAIWDDERWWSLAQRAARMARGRGELTALPRTLTDLAELHVMSGEMALAEALLAEATAAAEVTGSLAPAYGRLAITAWKGHPAELSQLIDQFSAEMAQREEGKWATACSSAAAVLNNGLGDYAAALVAAEACSCRRDELRGETHALAELVEAAARTGQADRGAAALVRLSELTRHSHTDWARGLEARRGPSCRKATPPSLSTRWPSTA